MRKKGKEKRREGERKIFLFRDFLFFFQKFMYLIINYYIMYLV